MQKLGFLTRVRIIVLQINKSNHDKTIYIPTMYFRLVWVNIHEYQSSLFQYFYQFIMVLTLFIRNCYDWWTHAYCIEIMLLSCIMLHCELCSTCMLQNELQHTSTECSHYENISVTKVCHTNTKFTFSLSSDVHTEGIYQAEAMSKYACWSEVINHSIEKNLQQLLKAFRIDLKACSKLFFCLPQG